MENTPEINKIEISRETLRNLNTIRKWAMFIAIIGYIFLGLIVVFGLTAGTFLSAFNSGENSLGISETLMFIIFSVLSVAYFFPIHFLFRFSKNAAQATRTLSSKELDKAFRNLRLHFVSIGIFIILIITVYILMLILTGASLSFNPVA